MYALASVARQSTTDTVTTPPDYTFTMNIKSTTCPVGKTALSLYSTSISSLRFFLPRPPFCARLTSMLNDPRYSRCS